MSTARDRQSPLNVLVPDRFADGIRTHLKVSCELVPFRGEGDDRLAGALRRADVLISSIFKKEWVEAGIPLQLIQGVGAGIDGIDLAAVPPGCTVCNVYGHGPSVAEYVFMVMAMLNRGVIVQDAALRRGEWGGGVMRAGLPGRRLLILGLGHIGAEVVRWGRFIGMEVHGLTRTPSSDRARALSLERIGGFDQLDRELGEADFVVVAIPHTADTESFIGGRELAQMKPAAYLVNVARGPVVDEAALYIALKTGQIAGAAVDVWYRYPAGLDQIYPPSSFPFHELDNIIMTPHNSGYTDRTMAYRFAFMAANIGRLAAGEPLENVIWPQHQGGKRL